MKIYMMIMLTVFLSCDINNKAPNNCTQIYWKSIINNEFIIGKSIIQTSKPNQIKNQFPNFIILSDPQYDLPNDIGNINMLVKENLIFQGEEIMSNRTYSFVNNKLIRIEYELNFSELNNLKISKFMENNGLGFLIECINFNKCYEFKNNAMHHECTKSNIKLTNGDYSIRYSIISYWKSN